MEKLVQQKKNKIIFNETRLILTEGITKNGINIKKDLDQSYENTRFFHFHLLKNFNPINKNYNTKIEIKDSFLNNLTENCCCFYFTHPKSISSFSQEGLFDQEGIFSACTTISMLLKKYAYFFQFNLQDKEGIYLDHIIYCPEVLVLRNFQTFEVNTPFKINVIVAFPIEKNNSDFSILEERLNNVFLTALYNNKEEIILGIFGTKSYKSQTEILIQIYKRILHKFNGFFKKITLCSNSRDCRFSRLQEVFGL